MQRIIINILFLLAFAIPGRSQDITTTSYQQLAQQEANALKNGMSLSPTQTDSVLTTLKNFYQSMSLLSQTLTLTQRKQAIDSLHGAKQASLQKILTVQQWNQYLQDMEIKKANMQQAIDDRRRQKMQAQQKDRQQ